MTAARTLGRLLGTALDATIVLSFDRTGYRVHALTFDDADLAVDLDGRRCLVTGATSGLGFAAACALAERGANVELLCRDAERGAAAARRITAATGNGRVSSVTLDVSSLGEVRRVGADLARAPVDVLIHNAGLLPERRAESDDGFEITFATHVAGPHLLTKLLRGALAASRIGGRVVWVSSGGMYARRLRLDDVDWRARPYDGVAAYAETKRAQVVLSELWAEELRGDGVVVNAMHPGWADTPGVRTSLPGFHRVMRHLLRTPAEGADTIVWLAASAPAGRHSGRFFFDREPRRTSSFPWTRETTAERRALWELCETRAARALAARPTRAVS